MSKTILITNQKGGTGKSTLTYNLAQNISANASVLVLDFDLQGSLSQIKDLVTDFKITSYNQGIEEIKNLPQEFIFLDSPPYLFNKLPELIDLVDLIIIPTKAGVLDLLAIKNTLELIKSKNKTSNSLVVFNMIKANTTLTLDILIGLEEYNIPIAKTHVSDLVSFTRSVLIGGVNDKNAQRQLDNLTKEILTKLI